MQGRHAAVAWHANCVVPIAMRNLNAIVVLLAAAALTGCHRHGHARSVGVPGPRSASLEVEVYDPLTDFVWEGVSVRIVEGAMEWSGCVCPNPIQDDWFLTDEFGTVFYDSVLLAESSIGFLEDSYGRAVLGSAVDEDEAYVLIELAAPGFPTLQYDILLSWDEPDVFVSIPYQPLNGILGAGDGSSAVRLGGERRDADSAPFVQRQTGAAVIGFR